MAILVANYDEQRDYLSNFEPFVLDRLKAWPAHEEVKPGKLSEQLSSEFNLPNIPINTVALLRDRATAAGYVRRTNQGKFFVVPAALEDVADIGGQRTESLGRFNALADSVAEHAKTVFKLDWDEEATESALVRFVEEFGVEMAMARRDGGLDCAIDDDEALAVIYSFARKALARDPTHLAYLEEMVKGSMLTNVLYFQDLGQWQPEISRLVAYVDTPIALRVLEVAPEEVSGAALEMVAMLQEFGVPLRIFEHTIEETIGVLNGVKGGLLRAIRGEPEPEDVGHFNRETVEHLLRRQWGPGEVEQLISDIETRLGDFGIVAEHTPPITNALALDEERFETIFSDLGYTKEPQIIKDVRSLAAIHRLRDGQPQRDLGSARAIFVTSNPLLIRVSNRFFSEQGHGSPVPQGITDISLTTQLWLRKPNENQDVPRKVLMAESYAALSPSAELWAKYLKTIERKRQDGSITDQQVKSLVISNAAREGLIEVTHGDADAVTDETPLLVLDQYDEVLKRPLEEELTKTSDHLRETRAENDSLVAEIKRLRDDASTKERELGHQSGKIRDLEDWKKSQEDDQKKRQQRWDVARAVVGILVAMTCLAAAVWLSGSGKLSKPLPTAIYFGGSGMAAVVSVGLGLKQPWGRQWNVILGIGAVVGIIAAIFDLLAAN